MHIKKIIILIYILKGGYVHERDKGNICGRSLDNKAVKFIQKSVKHQFIACLKVTIVTEKFFEKPQILIKFIMCCLMKSKFFNTSMSTTYQMTSSLLLISYYTNKPKPNKS